MNILYAWVTFSTQMSHNCVMSQYSKKQRYEEKVAARYRDGADRCARWFFRRGHCTDQRRRGDHCRPVAQIAKVSRPSHTSSFTGSELSCDSHLCYVGPEGCDLLVLVLLCCPSCYSCCCCCCCCCCCHCCFCCYYCCCCCRYCITIGDTISVADVLVPASVVVDIIAIAVRGTLVRQPIYVIWYYTYIYKVNLSAFFIAKSASRSASASITCVSFERSLLYYYRVK